MQGTLSAGEKEDGLKVGRDALDRQLPFENGSVLNPAGMIDVADSPGAVKKPVFEWRN